MVVPWACFLQTRCMFAYHFQMMQPGKRAKMCPTTCVVKQSVTRRKGLYSVYQITMCIYIYYLHHMNIYIRGSSMNDCILSDHLSL